MAELYLFQLAGTRACRTARLPSEPTLKSALPAYGIHWPDLDEDIGVEGLLLGKRSSESAASFERWLQRRRKIESPDAV